jgi:uncharacterized membrane protein YidH (DUF202 family)
MKEPQAPIAPILAPMLVGLGLFLFAFTIAIYQAARSNRPHELTAAPLVTLIQAGAVGLFALAVTRFVRAWRTQKDLRIGAKHWSCLLVLIPLIAVSVIFLVGAASTAIDVLGS